MKSDAVVRRQAVEKRIAKALVKRLLAEGFVLAVNNGEERIVPTQDVRGVLSVMFATDQEHIFVYHKGVPPSGRALGWVFFVYGNSGWDVISDYTVNLEPYMTEANAIADKAELQS